MDVIDEIGTLFQGGGGQQYGGERVTQLDHALQSAMQAEAEQAPPPLVVAALLHDIGHLLYFRRGHAPPPDVDDRHESGGAGWLKRWFGPEVIEPVRLHVDAKRYLCATESGYFDKLSPESVRSLGLQGGKFDAEGARNFIARPQAAEAVRVRRWDEAAKVLGLKTPDLAHYRPLMESLLVR